MKPSISSSLYSSPTRVYVLLTLLAGLGIFAGMHLPISLFPNSAKPVVYTWVSYGAATADEFQQTNGNALEGTLRGISGERLKTEYVKTTYDSGSASFEVGFEWGVDPIEAKKEVERVVTGWSARLAQDVRDSVGTWINNENSGFLAVSFYSETRSLEDLYEILEPALKGKISAVEDADQPELWNPSSKEIRVELKPESMASLQLYPRDIERALAGALETRNGGGITVGMDQIRILMPRNASTIADLGRIPIQTRTGRIVHLSDVATVDFGLQSKSSRIIKTSGSPSVILFATPKPGGNVKRMAEELLTIVETAAKSFPADIKYRILVDPSGFIRSAVQNVFHEVGIGSLLAVSVLFIFIGTFKNVATAAIEIPLSLVLAFILMRLTGVNINLISLGGLALSAGMNVDASVVVMENIFRHFEVFKGKRLSVAEKLAVVSKAVAEVRAPIVSSTIASLVVFVPLLMTSGLSQAILGDLAKAVIFSHGFSAIVALVLVPTVRMHLMSRDAEIKGEHSLFEKYLSKIEELYARALKAFLVRPSLKWILSMGLIGVLVALVVFVLPRLPREVVGTPDSDMIWMSMSTKGNTRVRQMESMADEVERDLLVKFGDRIEYTFTQINNPNRAGMLAKLKRKSEMKAVWDDMEKQFVNTPQLKFRVEPWNPSELPIPNPPALRVAVRGGDLEKRRDVALEIKDLIEGKQIFHRVSTEPDVERTKSLNVTPDLDQWSLLLSQHRNVEVDDLMDLSRVATEGRRIGEMPVKGRSTGVFLRFPDAFVSSLEDVASLPVGIGSKIVPLKSLLRFETVEAKPSTYRIDGQELFLVNARLNESAKLESEKAKAGAIALLDEWVAKRRESHSGADGEPSVVVEDAGRDITDAIDQLGMAVAASVVLIFVVLLIQFGTIAESLLVVVAVPLGFIGVLVALFVFRSSLSLNSVLGVILLNGIAVNNSIILVDFIRRLANEGLTPIEAALKAARLRLRPILITSLTTVLGMLPIALGFGEGGRILQPLGIAVSGGLWISMLLTLLLVPALQVSYLNFRNRRAV